MKKLHKFNGMKVFILLKEEEEEEATYGAFIIKTTFAIFIKQTKF